MAGPSGSARSAKSFYSVQLRPLLRDTPCRACLPCTQSGTLAASQCAKCDRASLPLALRLAAIAGRKGDVELDDGDSSSQAPLWVGVRALGTRTAALAWVSQRRPSGRATIQVSIHGAGVVAGAPRRGLRPDTGGPQRRGHFPDPVPRARRKGPLRGKLSRGRVAAGRHGSGCVQGANDDNRLNVIRPPGRIG
jgi:hypothetical protein